MQPLKISAEDETGTIELHPSCNGPGPMKIQGPCVIDATLDKNGKCHINRIRHGDNRDILVDKPKYKIGNIIEWNDTHFLVRKIEDGYYNTLSLVTGSNFDISQGFADSNINISLEA